MKNTDGAASKILFAVEEHAKREVWEKMRVRCGDYWVNNGAHRCQCACFSCSKSFCADCGYVGLCEYNTCPLLAKQTESEETQ